MFAKPDHSSAYRGGDRRGVIVSSSDPRSRPFVVAGSVLLIAWLLVTWLAFTPDSRSVFDLRALRPELDTAALAVAVVTGTLAVIRWRLVGDAPALWIGTAILVYAVCTIGLGDVMGATTALGVDTTVLGWLRPASVVVTIVLFVAALRSDEVDARLDGGVVIVVSFAAVTALTILLQALPVLSSVVVGAVEAVPLGSRSTVAAGVLASAWAVSATAFAWRGLRRSHQLFTWTSTMLFGLTFSELARSLAMNYGADWTAGGALLRTVAILLGLVGITRELQAVFAAQTSRLFDTHADYMVSEARLRRHIAEQEERAHEARNALTAIEGATITLEHYRDKLDEASQEALSRAVSSEIARLQRLVSASKPATSYRIAFDLNDVINGQVALARAQGARVITHLQAGIRTLGRPASTAEALQNLLTNARVHAAEATIVVRTARENDAVVVRVTDRGPGIPRAHRHRIFSRGARASTAPGTGLGLYVSRQLLRDQGGDLWFEEPGGGGACFAMRLPVATEGLVADRFSTGADVVDQSADSVDVGQDDVALASTGTDTTESARRRTGQADENLDVDPLG